MPYAIEDLSRLILHDSTLESASRCGGDLVLVFNWAKLTHLVEENITEPVILGRTGLLLVGIKEEKFSIYDDDTGSISQTSPNEGVTKLDLIIDNELLGPTILMISGLLNEAAGSNWVEWHITFDTSAISWNTFITQTEWLAGKLHLD
jgi:hypothetical protein